MCSHNPAESTCIYAVNQNFSVKHAALFPLIITPHTPHVICLLSLYCRVIWTGSFLGRMCFLIISSSAPTCLSLPLGVARNMSSISHSYRCVYISHVCRETLVLGGRSTNHCFSSLPCRLQLVACLV